MKKFLLFLALLALPLATNAQTLSQFYGGNLPSLASRAVIAQEAGIQNYRGTAAQNGQLLAYLQQPKSEMTLGATPGEPTSTNQGYNPVSGYQSSITNYVSASAVTIPVVGTKDKSGKQISLANISSAAVVKVYMNLEPGTSKEEPIMCTGVTATSWTGCTRGLPFQSGSEVTSSTAQAHNAGAAIIITNISQFYNQYLSIDGNQTINNVKTFTQLPLAPTTTPTDPQQLITLYQLQQATSTGGINASEGVKGVSQLATKAQAAAGTSVGSTGARLVIPNSMASSTNGSTTTAVITLGTGFIDSSFGGASSSVATLNNNALVVQNPASASTTPGVGVIPLTNSNSTIPNTFLNASTTGAVASIPLSGPASTTISTSWIPTTTFAGASFATTTGISGNYDVSLDCGFVPHYFKLNFDIRGITAQAGPVLGFSLGESWWAGTTPMQTFYFVKDAADYGSLVPTFSASAPTAGGTGLGNVRSETLSVTSISGTTVNLRLAGSGANTTAQTSQFAAICFR